MIVARPHDADQAVLRVLQESRDDAAGAGFDGAEAAGMDGAGVAVVTDVTGVDESFVDVVVGSLEAGVDDAGVGVMLA